MKLKYISWIPSVLIMMIIFYFSSKPVELSDESSLVIANTLVNVYESVAVVDITNENRIEILYEINHIVRKSAHFMEYALLAFFIAFHLHVIRMKKLAKNLLPILISAVYAASDEFHQIFVDGRGPQVRDVLLDTTGAIAGTLVFFLVLTILEAKSNGIIKLHRRSKTV